eukprot:2842880-Pyramimonas_sp.AAC.1
MGSLCIHLVRLLGPQVAHHGHHARPRREVKRRPMQQPRVPLLGGQAHVHLPQMLRALAPRARRAPRLRQPDAAQRDARRLEAHVDGVWVVAAAQTFQPWGVRHVEHVLDEQSVVHRDVEHEVGVDFVPGGGVHVPGHVGGRLARPRPYPDKAVDFAHLECADAHALAEGGGGHLVAGAFGVEGPAVVRALDLSVDDFAEGEGAGAVGALVRDARREAVLVAEEHPRDVEELYRDEHVGLEVGGELHREPEVLQALVQVEAAVEASLSF